VANTLNLLRNGAVGFIAWLDVGVIMPKVFSYEIPSLHDGLWCAPAEGEPVVGEGVSSAVSAYEPALLKPAKTLAQLVLSRYRVVDAISDRNDVGHRGGMLRHRQKNPSVCFGGVHGECSYINETEISHGSVSWQSRRSCLAKEPLASSTG
jgi:hypothetical protein